MVEVRAILSFIIPLLVVFYLIKKNANTVFFLTIGALLSGLISGQSLTTILSSLKNGFGSVLSQVGLLVLFGMIFSEYLEASGGIENMAKFIAKKTTAQGSVVAMYALGYVISIPVNFTAATAMISPLARSLSTKTGNSVPSYVCSFGVASFLTNCLVVPTLTPALLAGMAGIDVSRFMILGIIVSIIASLVAALGIGLLLAKKYGRIEYVGGNNPLVENRPETEKKLPSVKIVAGLLFFPIVLIMLGAFVPNMLTEGTFVFEVVSFACDPTGALLLATLVEMVVLRKYFGNDSMAAFNSGLKQASSLLIVLGAANGFGSILTAGGVGDVILDLLAKTNMPILLMAFIMVAVLHAGTGHMTVAAISVLPLITPAAQAAGESMIHIVCACCLGCVTFLLPNGTEFFIFRDAYGISNKDTLMSISIPGTVAGVIGIITLLILNSAGVLV